MAGKKSAASLAVVSRLPVAMQRPDPPGDLTSEQADEWRAVVARMPVGWFPRESHQVLATYCRHVVNARRLASLLDGFEPEWAAEEDGLKRYDKLLGMADREGKAITMTATRLRLTPQARYTAQSAATAANKAPNVDAKPWQRPA